MVSAPYVACTCSLGGLPAIVVTLLLAGYIYIALQGTTKKPLPQLKLGAVLSMWLFFFKTNFSWQFFLIKKKVNQIFFYIYLLIC